MPRRRFWSVFPASTREATDAIVANLLLHWFPARMRVTSLAWTPSLWLGTVSWVLFVSLLLTGLPLMVFYIPSTRDAYAVDQGHRARRVVRLVAPRGAPRRRAHDGDRRHAPPGARVPDRFVPERRRARAAPRVELGDRRGACWPATVLLSFTGYLLPWDQLALLGGHRQHEHRRVAAARRRSRSARCCSAAARSARRH